MDPFSLLQALWESVSTATGREVIFYALVTAFVCATPAAFVSWRLRRYAASHDRTVPKLNVTWANTVLPFADPRLNEVLGVIRKWSMPVGFAFCIVSAMLFSLVFDSKIATPAAIVLSIHVFNAGQYFCEACFAFGAQPAPAAEGALDGVARTA